MALNPTDLSPSALAQVAQIKHQASVWTALASPFKKQDEQPKAESEMSPEELQAKFTGKELDELQRSPDKNVEPGLEAEKHEMHMRTVAADMGIDTRGMANIQQIEGAVQVAQDNGGVAPAPAGDNYMANFVNGDVQTDVSIADVEVTGPAATPDVSTDIDRQIG